MVQINGQDRDGLDVLQADPDWIIDDNLLRDEGVLFGQMQADKTQKTDAIRSFYLTKNTNLVSEIEFIDQKLTEFQAFVREYSTKLSELYEEQLELTKVLPDNFNGLFRKVISTLVYGAILVAIFPSVWDWVSWRGDQAPFLAAGAYLFGSLSLFGKKSIVYFFNATLVAESKRELYKMLLEELFIPFIAAVFLIVYGYNDSAPGLAFLFWLLLFTVFLFAGKGFMVSLYSLRNESLAWQDNARHRRVYKNLIRDKAQIIEKLKEDYLSYRKKIEELEQLRLQKIQQMDRNSGESDRKIALFESEYALASNYSRSEMDDAPFFQ